MNAVFVTGMFRSGTTLVAKMLDAHPEVSFASDPYRPFFNDFCDFVAEKNGLLQGRQQQPLSDYFFDHDKLKLMRLIQQADLNTPLPQERLQKLIPIMAKRGVEFSPFVSEKMSKLQGKTYKELYQSMMKLVHECYGKPEAKVVGSKEVWSTEFTSLLARSFPEMKFVHIVRDPRAVFASRNIVGEKYPWLFLIRQWRKLNLLTHLFSKDKSLSTSLLVVHYENLVDNPEVYARRICDHIGVQYSKDMVDGTKFRDGDGSPWYQNTSYETESQKITTISCRRWHEVLTQEQVELIESVCFAEMKLWGYEPLHADINDFKFSQVVDPLIVPERELAGWIKEFSTFDTTSHVNEMMKEYVRQKLLLDPADRSEDLDKDFIEALYLDVEIYRRLHEIAQKELNPGGSSNE